MKYSIKTKLDETAYKRDDYKCRECGKEKGIEAHHIIPELEELDNLITLCHACHKRKHNMAGYFKKGFDPRQNSEGDYIGHPFRGNQYTGGIKEI